MKRLDKILASIGVALALLPPVMAALVMPQFRETFQSFGADLPLFTRVLADYPASLLLFAAIVLAVAFLWPKREQRGVLSIVLGSLFAILGPVMIVIGAYLPIWKLGAAI
jgi:type II secretory pathway component PulF